MLSVSSPLASAAERGATKRRLRTALLPRTRSQVVKPAQADVLTIPPLPESCRAASSARIASRALWSVVSLAESAAFVAYEASSAVSALEAWSAEMPVSRLASCAATKVSVARPSKAFTIFDKARLAANLEDLKFLKHKMNSLHKNDPVWTKKIEELANACVSLDSFLEDLRAHQMVCPRMLRLIA